MSDDDIVERGGSQEDIDAYAHDVGGACGAAYGGSCDYCGKVTPTEQDKELREAVAKIMLDANANSFHVHTAADDMLRLIKKHELQARIDEWRAMGDFLTKADKEALSREFLDLYRLHGERLKAQQEEV